MTNELKAIVRQWKFSVTKSKAIQLDSSKYGSILVLRHKETGQFEIKHQGAYANFSGKKAVYKTAKEALAHAFYYIEALTNGNILGKSITNMASDAAPDTKRLSA